MIISSNANSSQQIAVWRKSHQVEQGREDGIKSEMSAMSMEVGSDSTCFLFAKLCLRQLTTNPGKK